MPGKAEQIIAVLHDEIVNTFDALMPWFGKDRQIRAFRSAHEEWNAELVLEHVMLANHYLLLLIEKGKKKALRIADGSKIKEILDGYELSNPVLDEIGIDHSFKWRCPEHMIPTGSHSLDHVQQEVVKQRSTLLGILDQLSHGEGVIYTMHMSVHSLGTLDVYQYIYFLLKHMQRHIQQMSGIESEYHASIT